MATYLMTCKANCYYNLVGGGDNSAVYHQYYGRSTVGSVLVVQSGYLEAKCTMFILHGVQMGGARVYYRVLFHRCTTVHCTLWWYHGCGEGRKID